MDPDACVDLIVAAIEDEDWEEAIDHANNLDLWLNAGGFPPPRWSGGTYIARFGELSPSEDAYLWDHEVDPHDPMRCYSPPRVVIARALSADYPSPEMVRMYRVVIEWGGNWPKEDSDG